MSLVGYRWKFSGATQLEDPNGGCGCGGGGCGSKRGQKKSSCGCHGQGHEHGNGHCHHEDGHECHCHDGAHGKEGCCHSENETGSSCHQADEIQEEVAPVMTLPPEEPIIFHIQVLGQGNQTSREQYDNVLDAVDKIKTRAKVEYIMDRDKIDQFGEVKLPAVVVNGQVVAAGKVQKTSQIVKILKQLS